MSKAVGNTLMLAAVATMIGFALGTFFGFVAGYFRDTFIDKVASFISVIGVSVPHYWLGMVLVIIFAATLGWLPPTGAGPGGSGAWALGLGAHAPPDPAGGDDVGDPDGHHRAHGARAGGRDPRARSSSSACGPRGSAHLGVFRHVVKNTAPTALAVMGIQLGYLLGGSILIETVFSWPGTGFLLNAAIFQRDLPLLQGTILVLALFFVLLNLAVDVAADGARSAHPDGAEPMLMRQPRLPSLAPVTRSPGYWATVWRRFRRDPVAVGAALVILAHHPDRASSRPTSRRRTPTRA